MPNKTCNKCKQTKSVEFFAKRKDSKDGHRATCKVCASNKNEPTTTTPEDTPMPKTPATKVPTLNQLAKSTGKTFRVEPDDLLINWDDNIRGIDDAHAETFAESFAGGDFVPPILVKKTKEGWKLVAGYHRCYGYNIAKENGVDLTGLDAIEFKGGADTEVATMIMENDGKPLTGLERAHAYSRLRGMKWDINKIAAAVKRSRSDIEKHLILADATEPVKKLVEDGTIAVSTAIEFVRKHGDEAHTMITKQLAKQAGVSGKPGGKPKPVKAAPKFPNKSAQKVLDLIGEKIKVDQEYTDDTKVTGFFELSPDEWAELDEILEEFKTFLDEQENI